MKRDFAIVVKGIIIKNNQVLLLHRSEKEMQHSIVSKWNVWDLPGGGVQFFEPMDKALSREISEETSLTTEIIDYVGTYDIIKQRIHIGIVTYLCDYISGEVKLSEEHDEFIWLNFDEIENSPAPKWLKKYFIIAINKYKKVRTNT